MRRWVFSLYPSPTLLRLSPFCRGPPAHPATSRVLHSRRHHPALLRASRSRFPAVRQFGTEPQPRPEPEPRPNAGLEPTSAARSRSRYPQRVRQSFRLRLRRQPLHTATIRRPVTSCPITARKAVASPAATDQTRPEPEHRPSAELYYKRSFIARHPSQPDNDMRSAPAALRSRARALPPPSLPLAAEHEPFLLPRRPSQPSTGPSLIPLIPPPSPRAGYKKTPARCRAGVSFTENGRITSRSSRRSP